ncbi:hypothetical protein MIDIC_200020 [Alphaproteobacteria bacterium]
MAKRLRSRTTPVRFNKSGGNTPVREQNLANDAEQNVHRAAVEAVEQYITTKMDFHAIIRNVLQNHYDDTVRQSIMEIKKEIISLFGENMNADTAFGSSAGQLLSHFANTIQKTITRYL